MLEDQMCDYVPTVSKSPDRMDALIWGLTELSQEVVQQVTYEYDGRYSVSPDFDEAERAIDKMARFGRF